VVSRWAKCKECDSWKLNNGVEICFSCKSGIVGRETDLRSYVSKGKKRYGVR
jgi:hypothetical protein